MTQKHQIYFDFLRYSLDDAMPLPEGVASIVWSDLYKFAKKQSLVGIYYRGIQRLPQGVFSDIDLLAKWTVLAQKIQQKNQVVTLAASKITAYFEKNGYRTFVLKGQGNALMYHEPWLRSPGDVDLFVKGKDKRKKGKDDEVREIIRFCCEHLHGGKAVYHHIDVQDVDGVSVEVHYRPSFLLNPVHNQRLQKWFDANTDLQCSNKVSLNIGVKECAFAVPTTSFNIIYQLLHLEKHVVQSGLGLRQLIDYYMLLKTAIIIDKSVIEKTLKQFGMWKFAGAIMWVLHETLGLEQELMIAPPQEKFGRMILEDILEGGNFGQHADIASWKRDTSFGRNYHRFERDLKLCWYYPSEALCEPFFRIWHYFWRKRH